MVDLVTRLSPHFVQAYYFGSFALLDLGRPQDGYRLLESGFRANAHDWLFPFYLGFFAYTYGTQPDKNRVAAEWYTRAAALPGHLPSVERLAATLFAKGHEKQKSIELWAQVYGQGDKYARDKAVAALDKLLPQDKAERMRAVAPLKALMAPRQFDQFVADLFAKYFTP